MIQGGSQNKYSFHMQVSARPMGSSFDRDRRSSTTSGRSVLVRFAKGLRFRIFDAAAKIR
jgi:hypothetical protein